MVVERWWWGERREEAARQVQIAAGLPSLVATAAVVFTIIKLIRERAEHAACMCLLLRSVARTSHSLLNVPAAGVR